MFRIRALLVSRTMQRSSHLKHACAVLASLVGVLLPTAGRADDNDVVFKKHTVADVKDSEFMAACVFDVNHDGKLDIVCGGYWYEAPTWKKHFLRNVELQNGRPDGYAHQVLDVNGDGWLDVITVNWRTKSIKWLENPGPNLAKEEEWKAHVIAVPGSMETGRLEDILGDGTPCILPSTVAYWWELAKKPNPGGGIIPQWIQHDLPREIAGHGVGFGDINGDGRGDIIGHGGWAEAPEDRRTGRWTWHPEFELDQASIPIVVADVDGDGLNDIIWSHAHDYGIYWLKQGKAADGKRTWTKHTIDTSWAGAHAPLWVDLAGNGTKQLVVGRRYLAHEGKDPGEYDPQAIYSYDFDKKTMTWHKHVISYNDGTCFGLDPKAVDLTGSGRLDLVFGGRHGLYWLENLGKGSSIAKGETHDPLWFPTYTDHTNLMILKEEKGADKAVKTAFDWGQRRAQTLAAVQAAIGELPDSYHRVRLDPKFTQGTKGDDFVTTKISYGSDFGARVNATLLVPNSVKKNVPAVICIPDDARAGDKEAIRTAEDLAKKGFVCLIPEYTSLGYGSFDLKKSDGYSSGAMKAVWDTIRAIDLLDATPEVNRKRIGIVGHGIGGQIALLTAAFDYRVTATVTSTGVTSFAKSSEGALKSMGEGFMPKISSAYRNDASKVPFDFSEVIGSIMPRSVFLNAPTGDKLNDAEGVKGIINSVTPVFRLRNATGNVRAVYPEGSREFNDAMRQTVYAWIVATL